MYAQGPQAQGIQLHLCIKYELGLLLLGISCGQLYVANKSCNRLLLGELRKCSAVYYIVIKNLEYEIKHSIKAVTFIDHCIGSLAIPNGHKKSVQSLSEIG